MPPNDRRRNCEPILKPAATAGPFAGRGLPWGPGLPGLVACSQLAILPILADARKLPDVQIESDEIEIRGNGGIGFLADEGEESCVIAQCPRGVSP